MSILIGCTSCRGMFPILQFGTTVEPIELDWQSIKAKCPHCGYVNEDYLPSNGELKAEMLRFSRTAVVAPEMPVAGSSRNMPPDNPVRASLALAVELRAQGRIPILDEYMCVVGSCPAEKKAGDK